MVGPKTPRGRKRLQNPSQRTLQRRDQRLNKKLRTEQGSSTETLLRLFQEIHEPGEGPAGAGEGSQAIIASGVDVDK